MHICVEEYFNLTQKEYLKIKKFMGKNIYIQLKLYLHLCMNFLIFLKNVMTTIVIVDVIVIVNKIIENAYALLINILNFVKKIALFLKKLQNHVLM